MREDIEDEIELLYPEKVFIMADLQVFLIVLILVIGALHILLLIQRTLRRNRGASPGIAALLVGRQGRCW